MSTTTDPIGNRLVRSSPTSTVICCTKPSLPSSTGATNCAQRAARTLGSTISVGEAVAFMRTGHHDDRRPPRSNAFQGDSHLERARRRAYCSAMGAWVVRHVRRDEFEAWTRLYRGYAA